LCGSLLAIWVLRFHSYCANGYNEIINIQNFLLLLCINGYICLLNDQDHFKKRSDGSVYIEMCFVSEVLIRDGKIIYEHRRIPVFFVPLTVHDPIHCHHRGVTIQQPLLQRLLHLSGDTNYIVAIVVLYTMAGLKGRPCGLRLRRCCRGCLTVLLKVRPTTSIQRYVRLPNLACPILIPNIPC